MEKNKIKKNTQQQEELLSNVYVTKDAKAHAVGQSINLSLNQLLTQLVNRLSSHF